MAVKSVKSVPKGEGTRMGRIYMEKVSSAPRVEKRKSNGHRRIYQRQGEALPPQIFLNLSRFTFTVQTRKIGSVYSQENYRNCCHLMSGFKAKKASNSISAGAPPQTH